jgi:hypothetical protein
MQVRAKSARSNARQGSRRLKKTVIVTESPVREKLLRQLRQEYTPQVCAQTLKINEDFPVYGES